MGNPVPRKTKIVATIGPASDDPEILKEMLRAGMNVARLNLSHGSLPEHKERISQIRQAASDVSANVAIMIDTKGIEIRTGRVENGRTALELGTEFILYTDVRTGNEQGVSVSFKRLPREVSPGDSILLDDGAIELVVRSVEEASVLCRVVHGGDLGENKSVNLPNTRLTVGAIGPEILDDLNRELGFAAENDADYIEASFVQEAEDVQRMRGILQDQGVDIPIIAKIRYIAT